jgi:amphi-Trp domain-containing protein
MLSSVKTGRGWLMIIYRVPSTPSTSRVTVWKKVKELGAYLLQQSVYILPNLPAVSKAVEQLKEQIHHLGGESNIIEIASLGETQEKEIITGFNSNREEEYTEVIKAGSELLLEIEEESQTEDFHYADLEENEKHLQRVSELLDNVKNRDYFNSPLQSPAVELIEECRNKFEAFSHEVFSREGVVNEDKKPSIDTVKKYKEKQYLSKRDLSSKIRDIAEKLVNGTLEIEKKRIVPPPDSIALEIEFREQKVEKSLDIKLTWNSVNSSRKN